MIELQLKRARDDRRRYGIDDRAWWRRRSWKSCASDAVVDGRELRFRRTGLLGRAATAEDAATGVVVAEWRSGWVTTSGAELRLRRSGGWWKSEWSLKDDSGDLVRFESRGWTGSEIRLLVDEDARVSRPVLLFAAWLVACLTQDDADAAAGATAAVVASTGS
jgi:hypothetical protein